MNIYQIKNICVQNRLEKSSYIIGYDCISGLSKMKEMKNLNFDKLLVLIDENVHKIYKNMIISALSEFEKDIVISVVPAGEKSKEIKNISKLIQPFFKSGFSRKSSLISIGGGVVLDIGGFLSSVLLRGIKSIYIPTTLLSQIDASIGGKTGVNYRFSKRVMLKNMLGTFNQPNIVLTDVKFLFSLRDKEIKNGLGEMVKYHIGWGSPSIRDIKYFLNLSHPNIESIMKTVSLCQEIKLSNFVKDPFDTLSIREELNLGHTLGHALEGIKNNNLSHGEAVSIGLVFAIRLSIKLGKLNPSKGNEIIEIIQKLNLPTKVTNSLNELLTIMKMDKKNGCFVLVKDIGLLRTGVKVDEKIIKNVLSNEMI